jgi:hypothetical protein
MTERDDKLERAYRGLAREEPPASLDEAILAASRRALTKPSFTRRWGVPVSLAAMLVLAIGVTLEMQHEQPGVEVAPPGRAGAPAVVSTPATQGSELRVPEAKREEAATPSVARPVERPRAKSAPEMRKRKEQFAPPPEAAAPAAGPSPQFTGADVRNAPAAPPAKPEAPQAAYVAPPPASPGAQGRILPAPEPQAAKRAAGVGALQDLAQPWPDPRAELERIAKLRAEGHDEEADRALEQFRRRHPEYRIDDAMWMRVKPR